jgi:Asp-tRNA(Asn)/Glu-tRNA(Gln) amidotransferase A subunit family amidase
MLVKNMPALAVPYGLADGLPIGVQLIADPHREDLLFYRANVLLKAGAC